MSKTPKNETMNTAIEALSEIFDDPRINVWPNFRFRKSQRESEESRARSLQTYTKWAGGVAVFAYVFTHRDQIRSKVKEQVRGFKVGVVNPDSSVSILSGDVKIKKQRKLFRKRNIYEPIFDESTLDDKKIGDIKDAINTQKKVN